MPTLAIVRFAEEQSPDVLDDFSGEVILGIRDYLNRNTKRGTGVLADSIRAVVYGKDILVESDLPYAKAVDQGFVRPRSMWSLINKVVPLKLGSGTVVFRRVTLKSLLSGKWATRPRPGIEFVEKGVELARSRMSLRAQIAVVTQTASIS